MNSHSESKSSQKLVIMLGDKETGKTSILQKYTKCIFQEIYKETCGVDFYNKEIRLCDISKMTSANATNISTSRTSILNDSVLLNLWDTSGLENDKKILPKNLYKNASGFIVCCSYDSLESLTNIKIWLTHINNNFTNNIKKDTPVLIICNKFDIPHKMKKFGDKEIQITMQEILKEFLFNIKIYHEVSAKDNINIEYVFRKLIFLVSNVNFRKIKSNSESNSSITDTSHINKLSNKNREISFDVDTNNMKSFVLTKSKRSFTSNKCRSNCCK
jgi:small GTP-binding protein